MIVKTWSNGSPNKNTGAGFGVKLKNDDDYGTMLNWKEVRVGDKMIDRGNRKFTQQCPEIRSKIIGEFLIKNQLGSWEKGNPHDLELISLA
jgi:hypothetical protein